ncbi:LPXTG cell wall anchor domain-containing protein [Arthrobacter sp. TMN-49]
MTLLHETSSARSPLKPPGRRAMSRRATAVAGSSITDTAKNLAAGESYELWIHSEPVKLATVKTSANGTVSVTATIPGALAAGAHELTLQLAGTVVARTALVVTAAAVDPTPTIPATATPTASTPANSTGGNNAGDADDLANTGAKALLPAALALLLVLGGAGALVVTRRRRA